MEEIITEANILETVMLQIIPLGIFVKTFLNLWTMLQIVYSFMHMLRRILIEFLVT